MRPGIILVCGPSTSQAQADVESMLRMVGAPEEVIASGFGPGWAAAAVIPPSSEPTSGGCIHTDGRDTLIWSGEVFLPMVQGVQAGGRGDRPAAALLRELQGHGVEALAGIDGAFCGAWFDASRARWVVFNDKMGLIPVFWSACDDRLIVAPRAWLAWRASGRPLEISERGVVDLIRTQNMVDDHTLIEGVQWLGRGSTLTWSEEEGAGCEPYWSLRYEPAQITEQEAGERYLESMRRALARHVRCSAALMLGISGGLDGRLFLAICAELGRVPDCFSAGWPFHEDVRFGRQLARAAGASHEVAPMTAGTLCDRLIGAIINTDGLQSAAHLGPTATAQAYLAEHPDVVLLEGFFHGMVGGIAVPDDADVRGDRPPHQSGWAHKLLHSGASLELAASLLDPRLARESEQEWRDRVDLAYQRAPSDDPLSKAEYAMVSARRGRVDVLGTHLQREHVLMRNPAADAIMLRWHQTTPPAMRRARRIYIEVLKRHYPRFARVPRADGCWGMPITGGRLRREYHWQYEKLYRHILGIRHPWTRAWGAGSKGIRAWVFDVWRRSGGLQDLLADDARVLNWVRRDSLLRLWREAVQDPLKAQPLLTLATVETMVRWLEQLSGMPSVRGEMLRRRFQRGRYLTPDNQAGVLIH